MALRLAALPASLRLSLSTPANFQRVRYASRWAQDRSFSTFFTRAPLYSRVSIRRSALWLVPVAGGLGFLLLPRPPSLLPHVFASPTLIPCSDRSSSSQPCDDSLAERELSVLKRTLCMLRDNVWESILTARRFVHLFILFFPVILSSPILLVGSPEKRLKGERWGALWWYDFLVVQMERAGPTFVKVRPIITHNVCASNCAFQQLAQWAASRADLFPNALCSRLGKLHSRGTPHSLAHTKRIIERAFQRPFEEVFEEFDETPIGTGAVAQVRICAFFLIVPPR